MVLLNMGSWVARQLRIVILSAIISMAIAVLVIFGPELYIPGIVMAFTAGPLCLFLVIGKYLSVSSTIQAMALYLYYLIIIIGLLHAYHEKKYGRMCSMMGLVILVNSASIIVAYRWYRF
jgi:membrane-bound ClpP family serine protease